MAVGARSPRSLLAGARRRLQRPTSGPHWGPRSERETGLVAPERTLDGGQDLLGQSRLITQPEPHHLLEASRAGELRTEVRGAQGSDELLDRLVVHGADDRQVPVAQAHRTTEQAVKAARRDLIVIPVGEWGDQHCQIDDVSLAVDLIADWFEEEGDLREGARLRATFQLEGRKPRTFRPTVTVLDPGRRLAWLGRLAIPKLFDGEHGFAVRPAQSGTEFVHTERFCGILPPLLGGVLAATHEAFTRMGAALIAPSGVAHPLHPKVTEQRVSRRNAEPDCDLNPNRGVRSRHAKQRFFGKHGLMPLRDAPKVITTVARAGVLRPTNPRHLLQAQRSLRHWGISLAGALAATSVLHPDDVFVIDERGSVSRTEMHRRSNALAHALVRRGVKAGDLVAVLCRNHRGFIDCAVALDKLGAQALYLNAGFAGPQLRAVLTREAAVAIIYDEEFSDLVHSEENVPTKILAWSTASEGSHTGVVSLDALIAEGPDTEPSPPDTKGRAIILTSGTTGTPKGAAREQQTNARAGIAILERIPYRHGDVTLVAAPLFHAWGFGNLALGLLLNATVVLHRHFDPEVVLADIEKHQVTVVAAVPVMLQRVLELPPEVRRRYDASSLRIVALSGSSIPTGVVTRWMDEYGDNIYNLYGSTEVGWVSIATPEDLRHDPRTAGRPPLYTDVRLLDHKGNPVSEGSLGRIFVKSSLLFGGYTDGQTKEIIDGYMSTGDIGRFDVEGRLYVEGRDDEMIVSGGENVFPREVEDLLSAHPDILDSAVIGVPDDQFGQRLKAFIVRRVGCDLDADVVRAHVHENLARYKTPRDVVFLTEIPRNASGKIVKRQLP